MTSIQQNPLYLASQSPRRAELLQQLNLSFQKVDAPIEEVALPNETAKSFVLRMAIEKALNGFNKVEGKNIWVIGSDTAVLINDKVLGKPKNEADARRMLQQLSGTAHQVLTSIAVVHDGQVFSKLSTTKVTFCQLNEQQIQDYWQTEEPIGKAGSYAIQGMGAKFIKEIQGSYSGVMGLPLYELNQLLEESGYFTHG